jgi:hypothetical protein
MKKLIVMMSAGLILASCSGDLEKRVTDLERRIVTLENGGTASTSSANSNLVKSVSSTPVSSASAAPTSDVSQPELSGPFPEFDFNEEAHDFGTISEGEVVNHVFTFKNTGEVPLIIESAKGSCGCTVPQWPREPIPVGGSGNIEVSFNSKGKPGQQNKTVTITANTNPAITRLSIKANVEKSDVSASAAGPVNE